MHQILVSDLFIFLGGGRKSFELPCMHLEPVERGGGVSLHSDFDDMDVLRCTGISFLGILRFYKCTCKCTYLVLRFKK